MGEYNYYLVTVFYRDGKNLVKCAVKTKSDYFSMRKADVWEELPEHVKSCGPVVEIESIFSIVVHDLLPGKTWQK